MWTDPRGDLRGFLSDGPKDRPVQRKKVFGACDGANRTFYTFDNRLISGTLQVYLSDVLTTDFTMADLFLGEFTLTQAPERGTQVTASYYFQYFLDDELDRFLAFGYSFIGLSDSTGVAEGLKLVVLQHAAYHAWIKLAARWTERKSSEFLLEDAPSRDEASARVTSFLDLAKQMEKSARDNRKDFYNLRQDRGMAPASGTINRSIYPWEPPR